MLNTTVELVNKINQTKEELALMDKKILELEMDKLNSLIEIAKQGLLFEPIYENAFGEEDGYYNEEEFFKNDADETLNGTLVYFSGEFYEETEDGDVEISTQVFLIEDGSLMVTNTFTESYYCENCEQMHEHSHRIVDENQSLNRFDIGVIINNITVDLKIRASLLEERKIERIAKLNELKIAQ